MKKKINFLFFFLYIAGLCFILPGPCFSMIPDETPFEQGRRGVILYREENYQAASTLLRSALEAGELTFALTYADICHRNLDKGKHRPHEAAMWYVRSAEGGDADAIAYLWSLSIDLSDKNSEKDKTQQIVHIWARQDADRGFQLYIEEQFTEAAKLLKRASLNHCLAQELYGDICLRQLDGKPHSYLEASMWYLLSARGGDPQSLAYLKSLVPGILENDDHESQMKAIVGSWTLCETLPLLKPLDPGKVNNYLSFKYDRKINKTTAQKLPYLFERVASAIMFNLTGRAHSVIDDQLFPVPESDFPAPIRSCALSARKIAESKFITVPLVAFGYGPVYLSYFKSLDAKLDKKGRFLKKPDKRPIISPIFALLLDALYEVTKGKTANEFTAISQEDIKAILEKVESKDISNDGTDPICKEFDRRMRTFFTTPLSRQEEVVRATEETFYASLRSHQLDCSNQDDLEKLKTGLLMFYCHDLTLRNVSSTVSCHQALQEGQRYFVDLTVTVTFSPNFNSTSITGSNIIKLLENIQKRGVKVSIVQ